MKYQARTDIDWLILLVSLLFAAEFVLKFASKHPSLAPMAFFPGLTPYLVLGMAGALCAKIIGHRLGPRSAAFLFFWLGLAFCITPMGICYFQDHYPGVPLWSKMGLFIALVIAGLAFIITIAMALAGERLSRLNNRNPGKPVFNTAVFICLPLGILIAALAAPLGLLSEPLPPRLDQQPAPGAAPVKKNVVLISVDTLRADHLPAYGRKDLKTPNIDRLLKGGLIYSRARSTASFTLAGHTGMLTGRHPAGLGILSNESLVPEDIETIAGALNQAGWATTAILSSASLTPESGIDRGFAHCYTPYSLMKKSYTDFLEMSLPKLISSLFDPILWSCSNRKTADTALAWLSDSGPGQPFFLFIHFWGVHSEYKPPLRYYWSANRSDPFLSRFTDSGRYRGELLDVDDQVGRIFDWLEEEGLWDDTIIVLTADHGEGLWEHGYLKHIWEVYEEQLRVPLIIHPAGASGETTIRDALISTAAVPNLVLHQLGFLEGEPETEEYVRSISAFARKTAITDGDRKQILVRKTDDLSSYDLRSDPGELKDLKLDQQTWPDLTGPLTGWRIENQDDSGINASPERLRGLKALGYL